MRTDNRFIDDSLGANLTSTTLSSIHIYTGIVTITLLYIGLAPASTASFGIFVALLYACFPFTVISQLSTGPMLEATSPPDKRGLAQGVNITVMNLGAAVSPFILGAISDMAGTPVAIWICIAISFIAAFGELLYCLLLLNPYM